MLLGYNRDNTCVSGCHGASDGLSHLDREGSERNQYALNRRGLLPRQQASSLDPIELSQRPSIFSHTNVKAIHGHSTTINGELILACVAQGGVIGLTGLGIFLGAPDALAVAYIRQIDCLAERAGTCHIVLGLHRTAPRPPCPRTWRRTIDGQSSKLPACGAICAAVA